MAKRVRVPSDIVIIIISLLGEYEIFPSNKGKLYKIFYELSKRFTALFKDFIFDESQFYPKCETISYAIDRLATNGLVEWILDGDYIITPSLVERGKKLLELFSRKEKKAIQKAAKRFKKLMDRRF